MPSDSEPTALPSTLIDALIEGFQVIGFDYRYLYLNPDAASHGRRTRNDLLGRTMMECYPGIEHTEMFSHLRSCLEARVAHILENVFTYPDGSLAHFELRIEPVPQGACVLSIDVSARKEAEARLREQDARLIHSERMEAVGMLAAGIAHDFNTLLSVMLGYRLRRGGARAQSRESNARTRAHSCCWQKTTPCSASLLK